MLNYINNTNHHPWIKQAERQTLAQSVAKQLLEAIRKGLLKPGERLPPERELMAQLKVSRTSLREGLQALAIGGVINTRPGHGTYINVLSAEQLLDSQTMASLFESKTLTQLSEVRGMLEIGMVSLAAERATEEDLKILAENVYKMEKSATTHDRSLRIKAELDFHGSLARATKNVVLLTLLGFLHKLLVRLLEKVLSIVMSKPGRNKESIDIHRRLYEAIRSQNKDEAECLMREHQRIVGAAMSEYYAKIEREKTAKPPI
jgi:GntR family transcriptional repressor for pyruvate dehydrogenase complex